MTNESHVIGEIFLWLIRFIHNYCESMSSRLILNGMNLISLLSFFFKMPDTLADYALRKFYEINYIPLKQNEDLPNKEKVLAQAETFMGNMLDKLHN